MNIVRKLFEDKSGRVVIAQRPNLPLISGVIASLLALVPFLARFSEGLSLVAFGALFTWAWLEICSGVNFFRRLLGVFVMAWLLAGRL